jgi:hypothetical protein
MSNTISRLIHQGLKKILISDTVEGEISSELIRCGLMNRDPFMIARFGSTEIKAILYPVIPFFLKPFVEKKIFDDMRNSSGFFPSNKDSIMKFSEMMIEDMQLVDILGSWRMEEFFFKKYISRSKKTALSNLEPYFSLNPWSKALENKRILVIHPFSQTIENQYFDNRDKLFSDKRVLPKFKSLETIKAVQTVLGTKSSFYNWFDALDFMKSEIDKKDFDVAIIGCGAYGFPLAAHVKRMGKKAIHLGGATQILFGIKGKRWLENKNFDLLINEHFVFPAYEDKVENFQKIEGGAYW